MKRILIALVLAAVVAMVPASALAAAPAVSGTGRVVPLGMALHKGRLVEGYAFIHVRANATKPARPAKGERLYEFLARGATWRSAEPYVLNATNADGASAQLVADSMSAGTTAWMAEVPGIFGAASLTDAALAADWTTPDDVNEVLFSQDGFDSQTVAVTVIWGVFSGPLSARELIEWDMVFNDAQPEAWGDAGAGSGVWDVQDIATHELGHAAGLGDLYSTSSAEQTMYGYASVGEVKKRTLEAGDIAGIRALYQ